MPIRLVDWDAWYPVGSIRKPNEEFAYGKPCEFTEEEIAFIDKAFEDFNKAQELIRKAQERHETRKTKD